MGQIRSAKRTELRVKGRLYRQKKILLSRNDRSLFLHLLRLRLTERIDILYNL